MDPGWLAGLLEWLRAQEKVPGDSGVRRDLKRWARVRGKELRLEHRPDLSDPTPASLFVIAAYLDGQDWIGVARALQPHDASRTERQ